MLEHPFFKSSRNILLIIIVAQILLHLPFINNPPTGQHTWRQVMGLAPARNYYEEGNRFLYPSQDIRIEKDDQGITYFEFPLLYWLIGQSYHATGFSHANGRFVMLLFGIILILGAYKLIRELGFDEAKARWYVFFLSCAPYFFYYSISVSPNLPALSWFTLGLGFLLAALKKTHWSLDHIWAVLFLTLGVISKSTYFFFGIPVAYAFIHFWLERRDVKIILFCLATAAAIFGAAGYLYVHMQELAAVSPWERTIHLVRKPMPFPDTISEITRVFRYSFNEWFLQLFVNSGAMVFFFVGLYQAFKQGKFKTFNGGFWVSWGISFLIFYFLFFRQFREHSYYQTPLLLFASAASAYGIQFFLNNKKWRKIAVVFVVLVPMIMVGRVYKRWTERKQVPNELLYQAEEFQKIIPEKERVLVFGDRSPMIFLYYLHRKGVVGGGDSTDAIHRYKNHGFKWVVNLRTHNKLEASKKDLELKKSVGDFDIYQIIPEK